ncbi:hypothetical protein [Compostimonas suwonensis]|nr:hypothetical protein [Compostimonas suwonensis]
MTYASALSDRPLRADHHVSVLAEAALLGEEARLRHRVLPSQA